MQETPPSAALAERVRREILESGPLTFARFMELCLYDPEEGYYSTGSSRLGAQGDYVTASDVGRHLGRALARQLLEIDRRIGPLAPFHLVEFGCGRGLLARDILDELSSIDPDLRRRIRPILVDRSAAMRAAARARVSDAEVVPPGEVPSGLAGAILAVELFDALPAHRLRRRGGRLREVRVGIDERGRELVDCEAEPDVALAELAGRYGAAPAEGDEAELTPLAADQLREMVRLLDRGMLIAIDYGDRSAELYGRRPHGTLLAYRGQRTSEDLLGDIGEQDLTAHVNFSLLEDEARTLGLAVLGLTTQDRFLIANGILEVFMAAPDGRRPSRAVVKDRLQALQLLHPDGMGRAFKVLVLSKGVDPLPQLRGLADPFAR